MTFRFDHVGECPRCGVRFIADRPGIAPAPCGACQHPIRLEREPAPRLFEPAPEQVAGQTYMSPGGEVPGSY